MHDFGVFGYQQDIISIEDIIDIQGFQAIDQWECAYVEKYGADTQPLWDTRNFAGYFSEVDSDVFMQKLEQLQSIWAQNLSLSNLYVEELPWDTIMGAFQI